MWEGAGSSNQLQGDFWMEKEREEYHLPQDPILFHEKVWCVAGMR
jgi:hypothetical protein